MTKRPSVPLEFARPSGNVAFLELSSSRTDSIVDAQRNTRRAVYSVSCRVRALITRTPRALPRLASYSTCDTTLCGRSVSRPVARAAGSVEPMELKYECVWQPRSHGPQ